MLKGIGGAMMTPVGRLVLLRSIDKSQLVNAMAWLVVPAMIGPMIGPPLGGFITTYFHWRWIFWINIPIGIIGFLLLVGLWFKYKDSAPPLARQHLKQTTFISLIGAFSLIAITVEADTTPYTAGANDNATGSGLVLTFAEDLISNPLANTRVWLVCTGSEESLHEGATSFFRAHKHEFVNPVTVNFEMLGCTGPSYIVREGLLLPLKPDGRLLEQVEHVAGASDIGAYPVVLTGGCTEASDSMIAKVPAITLIGLERDGFAPHWHMPSDTFDKMDEAIISYMRRHHNLLIGVIHVVGVEEASELVVFHAVEGGSQPCRSGRRRVCAFGLIHYRLLSRASLEGLLGRDSLHSPHGNAGLNCRVLGPHLEAPQARRVGRVGILASERKTSEFAFEGVALQRQLQQLKIAVLAVVKSPGYRDPRSNLSPNA